MKKEILKKSIEFNPAYDRRDPNPSKNYGIHGVDMRWYLKGESGVVQFVVYTGWHLPHVREELRNVPTQHHTMGADVGYHSKTPMYEGQEATHECNILNGPCYYDGSGLHALEMFDRLTEEGGEVVWVRLQKYYERTFGVETEMVEGL